MKKILNVLEFVVKVLASILVVDVAIAVFDYCNIGYWRWTGVPELVRGYMVVVGAAYVGFHLDDIVGKIYSMTHKEVRKPQFVVKGGDLERS